MNLICSWSYLRFTVSLPERWSCPRSIRRVRRSLHDGWRIFYHQFRYQFRVAEGRQFALAILASPVPLVTGSSPAHAHHNPPSHIVESRTGTRPAHISGALPPYYWAIPERSLISTMLSHPVSQPFHYLDRDGGSLEDVSRQSLAYPQSVQAIMLDNTEAAIACARSWLQPLRPLGPCGQPAGYFRNVLFWDPSRIATPPHWATLWDVARYPGQRAFFENPRITLEIALLADGVPPSQIYELLSTQAGVERAFHKLDQLRPYIIWWRSPSQAYHILREQTVLMGVAPGAIILSSQTRHTLSRPYLSQNEAILYSAAVWGIPATLPAQKANETKAILLTNPPHLPGMPTPLPVESLEINDSFWATHALQLNERFHDWLAHSSSPAP